MYLFVDSTRETTDKNIELIVSLTSLSRWYDAGSGDGGGGPPVGAPMAPIAEKVGKGAGTSSEKTPADLSPARGFNRQRTNTSDTLPQLSVAGLLNDGSTNDSKDDSCFFFCPRNCLFLSIANSVPERISTATRFTYCRTLLLEITFHWTAYSSSSYNGNEGCFINVTPGVKN